MQELVGQMNGKGRGVVKEADREGNKLERKGEEKQWVGDRNSVKCVKEHEG